MKIFNKPKGILFFYAFDIVLFVVLGLTFIPMIKNKRTSVNSAVLNPKYVNQVKEITIEIPSAQNDSQRESVHLEKIGECWIGSDTISGNTWPCDSQTVENMISILSKTVRMYNKSKNKSSWADLYVDEENAKIITVCGENGTQFSKLYYGMEDGILRKIAVRSEGKENVLQTENDISTYLNADASFWADPYLYPEIVTEYSRAQSETLLRRGKIISFNSNGAEPDRTYIKAFENEATVYLKMYENSDNTYSVKVELEASPFASPDKMKAISKLHYSYSISTWTYDNLDK